MIHHQIGVKRSFAPRNEILTRVRARPPIAIRIFDGEHQAHKAPRRPLLLEFLGVLCVLCGVLGCGAVATVPATPPSAAVLATIPVGAAPTLLAVARDGKHVYAASNGSLTVIDTASRSAVATLPINPNSTAIAVTPNGSR